MNMHGVRCMTIIMIVVLAETGLDMNSKFKSLNLCLARVAHAMKDIVGATTVTVYFSIMSCML